PARSLLDRQAHRVAPFGPAAVVVLHLLIAEQVGEHEPGVTGALADAAVGHDVFLRRQALLLLVDRPQLGGVLAAPVVGIGRPRPRYVLGPGDVAAAQPAR